MIQLLRPRRRFGAATVEFAILSPLLAALLLGIWEIGRVIDCTQVVNNAAREAGRKAATTAVLDPTTGQTTNVTATDVTNAAKNYLAREGYNTANVTVTFSNQNHLLSDGTPDSAYAQPYQASRLDHLRVVVTIPYADVQWGVTFPFMTPTSQITATVDWYCLDDDAFTVNSTVPF